MVCAYEWRTAGVYTGKLVTRDANLQTRITSDASQTDGDLSVGVSVLLDGSPFRWLSPSHVIACAILLRQAGGNIWPDDARVFLLTIMPRTNP